MSTPSRYLFAAPFFEDFFGYDLARSLQKENDYHKLFDSSKERINAAGSITTMSDGTVKIEEEVPGFSKEDIKVLLKEGCLSVTLKHEGRKEKHFTYQVSNKIDTTKITASCKDGILTMLLPLITKKQVEPLTIAVN